MVHSFLSAALSEMVLVVYRCCNATRMLVEKSPGVRMNHLQFLELRLNNVRCKQERYRGLPVQEQHILSFIRLNWQITPKQNEHFKQNRRLQCQDLRLCISSHRMKHLFDLTMQLTTLTVMFPIEIQPVNLKKTVR